MRARAAAALAFVVAAAGAENRTTTLRDLPVGTRGRWEYKDGAFVFYNKRELVLRLRAPTVKKAKRSHDHHGTFDASCLMRADPTTVLAGMRGGWGVLETGKPTRECEQHPKKPVCRDQAAEKRRTGEWVPLAIMTVATRDAPRRRLLDKARRSWRLWQAIGRRRDKRKQPAPKLKPPAPPAPTSKVERRPECEKHPKRKACGEPPQEPPPAPEQADESLPWVQRREKGTKLGRVAGYLKREAVLFKGMDRAIAAAGATPNVLDIGANHGLFAIFAALRGAKVAAVEAQATLAGLVEVSALANGVDVAVYHNAVLDVPAVVEIAELGASDDSNEGGTASLGAARGEVRMAQVRTASVDLVAGEVFGTGGIDFLKIDVEGVEIPALRSSLELLGRGGVREASVEFGPAKRWAESETHGVAGANPAAAVDVLHKIDAAGYDAYLTWGRFCVPPLNATGELADEAFARECQLALVKGGLAHPCRK